MILSLSDTIGSSDSDTIEYLFLNLIRTYSHIEFGAHLHTTHRVGSKKLMQLTQPVAHWQKTYLQVIGQPKKCCPILLRKKHTI